MMLGRLYRFSPADTRRRTRELLEQFDRRGRDPVNLQRRHEAPPGRHEPDRLAADHLLDEPTTGLDRAAASVCGRSFGTGGQQRHDPPDHQYMDGPTTSRTGSWSSTRAG